MPDDHPADYDQTLSRHGLRYRMNGFPIIQSDYDSADYGKVIGYLVEPIWNRSEMSESQLADLDEAIAETRRELIRRGEWKKPDSYWTEANLHSGIGHQEGVACDHPEQWRKPWPPEMPPDRPPSWECGACGVVTFVPPKPRPVRHTAFLVGGPFDGERMQVQPGQMTLYRRVPVPLEIIPLAENAEPMMPSTSDVVYRFTGRHHEIDPRILEFAWDNA